MKISQEGINLIKKWETFVPKVYQDSVGVWTIGYGHTKDVDENTLSINQPKAESLLKEDLDTFERQLVPLISRVSLNQNQYDAVVSFCFNLGTKTFEKSNAYKEMKINPKSKYIADSWITFRNAGGHYLRGLLKRRLDELTLYYK